MKKWISAGVSLLMILSVLSCGNKAPADKAAEETTTAKQNTVVIAMGSGFSTLDPGYVYEQNPPLVINACYETLFKFVTGSDAPQPSLTDSFSFSENGKVLTVVLKDAKFASGNPVTSRDVQFSLNRVKNLKGNPAFICDTIESITCPDERTVVITLSTSDSAILSKLCYVSCSILDSKTVIAQGGTDGPDASTADSAQGYLDSTSAGSGMFIMESYIPDEEIVLAKNENYWGTPTNVDKYVIKLQDNANTQMMGLSGGELDIALNLTDDTLGELEGKDNVSLINSATKTVGFLMLNADASISGPLADVKVQQAIRNALDFKGMQIITGSGALTPRSFIQVGFMGSLGERKAFRDLEKARQLLAEAGYADGFETELTVSELDMEGVPLVDLAQKVKQDLSEIGINIAIKQQDWGSGYGDDYRNGNLAMTVIYWGIDYNDPNVQLVFLPGKKVGLRANWTDEGYDEVTALYDAAMAETDNTRRSEILLKIQETLEEDSPFVMLVQAPSHVGYNKSLSGVAFSDDYRVDLTEINLK